MSIDAIALLHIPDPAFRRRMIERHRLASIGIDCVIVKLGFAFVGFELRPEQVCEVLSATLGDDFDAHDDPRGVLFASEAWVPTGTSYRAAIAAAEKAGVGIWAPLEVEAAPKRDADLIELVEELGGTCDVGPHGELIAADMRNTAVTASHLEMLARGDVEILSLGGAARSGGGLSRAGLGQLASFKKLRVLRLIKLAVTDDDFSMIAPLSGLEELHIERAPITGAGFDELRGLKKLTTVAIRYCKLDDEGLEAVARLPALNTLDLEPANVTDAGFAALAGTKVRILRAGRTRITDKGVAKLAAISGLAELSLASTGITDAVVAHLKALPALRVVDVRGTQLSRGALAALKALPRVERVVVGEGD